MADARIEPLQRQLLAVLRGGRFTQTWAKVNGIQGSSGIDTRSEIGRLSDAREIRARIRAIDPNAALYYGWGGPGDSAPCARCNGLGLVKVGELPLAPFSEGSITVMGDCPECRRSAQ
jgi:hypothetical protein